VLKDKDIEDKMSPRTWEAKESGFWSASPYIALSDSFLYPEQKVVLYQHNIITEKGGMETYRFWTHFFSYKDVTEMLLNQGFLEINFWEDILPEGEPWDGDNVIFTSASK
jgi:hypothetical protein